MFTSHHDVFLGICPKQRPESLTLLNDVYGWICTEDRKLCKLEGKA